MSVTHLEDLPLGLLLLLRMIARMIAGLLADPVEGVAYTLSVAMRCMSALGQKPGPTLVSPSTF